MELHLVKRDGTTIGVCDAAPQGIGIIQWFHANCAAYSSDHALKHEGYSLDSVDDIDCRDVTPIIESICSRAGVTMAAEFVPFSRSRNAAKSKDEKPWLSLNWKVTLQHHGRAILETDYAQGSGHAPSAKAGKMALIHSGLPMKTARQIATKFECETGRVARFFSHSDKPVLGKPIDPPRLGDVVHCLIRDADVLDAGGFESWAADFGYDTDSRAAESTYKACIDIATKLRAGLGAALLAELALVAQFN